MIFGAVIGVKISWFNTEERRIFRRSGDRQAKKFREVSISQNPKAR